MINTYKGLLQTSGHIVLQTFPRHILHTDTGRQDMAIGNYGVQILRIIDRICFSTTVEHGTAGERRVQDAEPNFGTNIDAFGI